MPNPLRQAVKRSLEFAVPRRLFLVRGSAGRRLAALTFDDGPDPEHTGRILDILQTTGAKGTFFVVGEKVVRHPDVTARIAAEGHELGHHSFTHSEPRTTSAYRLAVEIGETRRALSRCCPSVRPRFIRPPHGKVTPAKLLAAWGSGLGIALWSADPKDFAATSDRIREHFRRAPITSGDVVLLHDTSASTVAALPEIIRTGQTAGLAFVRLGDLVG